MKLEKKKITLKNGETLAYIESEDGQRPIILIHGNMSSSVHYKPLLERLPKHFKCYAIDLRGFGDSTYHKPIESLYDFASDIQLFMEQKKIENADIIGWSTGGGIALGFAAMFPSMTNKLVLIESASHRGYPIFKKDKDGQVKIGVPYVSKNEMATDILQVLPALKALENNDFTYMSWLWDVSIYSVSKPTPEDNQLYINETLKQRNLVDLDWALATFNMSDQPNAYRQGDARIHLINTDVLHIWSKKDYVVLEYMVKENIDALKENSKLVVYDNAGHSPLVDCPDDLALDIIEFLK